MDLDTFLQLTANGVSRGAAIGLLAVGVALVLSVTQRFHFAYGALYTLTPYLAFTFHERGLFPPVVDTVVGFWPSVVLAIVVTAVLGGGVEKFLYRRIEAVAPGNVVLAIFVASLGLNIALQNLIALLWGFETQPFVGPVPQRITWGPVRLLNFDVWQVAVYTVLAVALGLVLRFSAPGRAVCAVRSNRDLAQTIGLRTRWIAVAVFVVATALAGVVAIGQGLQFTVKPTMGDRPLIYANVAAFLAGTSSPPVRVFATGLGLVVVEQWSSMWMSVRWSQTTVFIILVMFLLVKGSDSALVRRIRTKSWRTASTTVS